MNLLKITSRIALYAKALIFSPTSSLFINHEPLLFDQSDLNKLLTIEQQLKDMVEKYNPKYFEPME